MPEELSVTFGCVIYVFDVHAFEVWRENIQLSKFQNPLGVNFFFFYPSLFFPQVPISIILVVLHQIECLLPLPCGMVAAARVCGGAGGAERMTEGVEKESDRVTLWQCIWGMGRMIQPQVWLLLISPWGLALGNSGVLWQQQWASHCFQERIQI